MMKKTISLALLFLFLLSPQAHATKMAIIIDDFGGDVKGVEPFLAGEIPITVAIMPFHEHAKEQAIQAHEAGLEVIIHMPMEPKQGKASWLGPNAITSDLTEQEIKKRVQQAIENVPYAVGMNNHMGSKIVEDQKIMKSILEVVHENKLYFLDSGTSNESVIPELAEKMNIPFIKRDIFIDDSLSSQYEVEQQIDKLMKISQRNGQAVGIGHVGVKGFETFSAVENGWKKIKQNEMKLVFLSELMDYPLTHQLHHIQYDSNH